MDTTSAAQNTAATAISYGGWSLAQLILIGVVALIVIVGIVAGMRLKRRRSVGERNLVARREAAGRVSPPPPPAPVVPPVAPPPPPLADEPVVAAAPLEASPATLAADLATPPAPEPAAAPAAGEEDLALIKGVGPKLVTQLGELGITRISQIAALTPADAEALDARLGAFQGRMKRDRWIDQAQYLAAGDRAGFEAEFGKL